MRHQAGLTVEKAGQINEFSGRVLEIEGVEHLSVEQRSNFLTLQLNVQLQGCTVKLSQESIEEYLNSNIVMLRVDDR
ncbi:hypothetical protein OK016_05765 [Vibrio chagasii]|nr:hypothetical protein [Vibrio chagasii]